MKPTSELPDRVRVKFTGGAGCWVWTAAKTPSGYGKVWWQGRLQPAHRVVFELLVGPIPPGLHLDHLCRRTLCVKPSHLQPVTCRENILRGTGPSALAASRDHCIHGHPYDERTYVDSQGARHCETCRRQREKTPAYRAKHAAREARRRQRIAAAREAVL